MIGPRIGAGNYLSDGKSRGSLRGALQRSRDNESWQGEVEKLDESKTGRRGRVLSSR